MKSKGNRLKLKPRFLIIGLLLFFCLPTVAQKNVTTIYIDGATIKKKPIIDSLAKLLSRNDLKKADSCIQIIFNAVHRKDTAAKINGIKAFQSIVNSEKYVAESKKYYANGILCCALKLNCCYGTPINPYPDKKATQ